MLETGLLRHDRIPGDALDLLADGPALLIRGHDAALGDYRDLPIVQEEDIARVVQDGGDVGGDEVLVLAQAHDEGRTIARRDDLHRVARRHGAESVAPRETRQRAPDGVLERQDRAPALLL